MTLIVAAVMVCLQVGWAITWTLGSVGILFHQEYIKISDICTIDKCEIDIITGPSLGIMFFFFLIFFWGATVLKNIIAVTVSGTVASWKLASNSPLITISAWLRAMTLSLGSICFGSLIVAILEAVRQVLNILTNMAKESGNCCAACLMGCLSCMIGCVERLVEFFNRFAYAYIGYYGYSFVTASKHVFQLFRDKGWSAIINDDLTQNVFFLGNIIIGAITAYIGIELVKGTDDPNQLRIFGSPEAIIAFFAFCSGYAINNLLMSVIASAVTTVFVLWAEDPHGWQLTRPEAYHALHQAWLEIYPEEYNNGYGKIRNNGQNFDRF
jgi:hypothetical protein